MSGVIRSILGDLAAMASLGRCDAHEHVALAGTFIAERFPEFLLDDVDASADELRAFASAGGGWVVDSMPTGPGRAPGLLAEVSRASGVPIVMATGLHLSIYHKTDDPLLSLDREGFAELFTREVEVGIDGVRCGVIKVAGGAGRRRRSAARAARS